MVKCVIPYCKNTSSKAAKKKNGITFHRFPKDKTIRKQWEAIVNRDNWSSTQSSAVCSEHFEPESFYIAENGLRRLATEAIPTVKIAIHLSPASTMSNESPADMQDTDTKEVISLKCRLKRLEVISENRKRRIYLMGQRRKQLKRKLQVLQRVIRRLIRLKNDTLNMNTENYTNMNLNHMIF